jgi:hypothetical protein
MSATHVVVEGTVKPDGSLELDSNLELARARVQLFMQPLPGLPKDDPFWQMMERNWAHRKAAELAPRSTEEIEAQRRAIRDDVEEKIERALRPQEKSAQLRRGARGESMIVCLSRLSTRCTWPQRSSTAAHAF